MIVNTCQIIHELGFEFTFNSAPTPHRKSSIILHGEHMLHIAVDNFTRRTYVTHCSRDQHRALLTVFIIKEKSFNRLPQTLPGEHEIVVTLSDENSSLLQPLLHAANGQ